MTKQKSILELSGEADSAPWYVEGHSPIVDEMEGGGTWFCFETSTFDEAARELRSLGFSDDEITTARSADLPVGPCLICGEYDGDHTPGCCAGPDDSAGSAGKAGA